MLKVLLFFLVFILLTLGGLFVFNYYVAPLLKPSVGRLNVTTTGQEATVIVGGKNLGKTPFFATNLRVGDQQIELQAQTGVYHETPLKINTTLTGKTLSIINFDFANSTLFSSGESLSFRPGSEGVAISTRPAGATIQINGQDETESPLNQALAKGAHTLTIKKAGYLTRNVVVNVEAGFRLEAIIYLAADPFASAQKIDGTKTANLFALANKELTLYTATSVWAEGIEHVQGGFTGAQTRFDAVVDEEGKLYIFDPTQWKNKKANQSPVNIGYLAESAQDPLSNAAQKQWTEIKTFFP